MTTNTDIVNRALQRVGTRTDVTDAELAAQSTNEAIQATLIIEKLRQDLLRMAPWDCALNYANLTLITAAPGTPENPTAGSTLWAKGTPPPPWAYEYQYPVDCLRACWIIPQFQTGFAGGVPITTAVTGGAPAFWQGPPVKFKVAIDQFYSMYIFTVTNGGVDYAAEDILSFPDTPDGDAPIGAPGQIRVLTVNGSGTILTVEAVNQVLGADPALTGSYFLKQAFQFTPSGGEGTGAIINVSYTVTPKNQRVILTNQEFATLAYVKDLTDIDVMDPLFQDAWVAILGARLTMALTGDKGLANMLIQESNAAIIEARKADGNEGLTVNDVTPDFIRIRGTVFADGYSSPYSFDWGSLWPTVA